MKHSVTWVNEKVFLGNSASNHGIIMDAGGMAPSPMELVLLALAGCTGIDVVNILKRMRQRIDKLIITVEGKQAEEYPKVFTQITLHYHVKGEVEERKLKRAIELSQNTYCSVGAMLAKTAKITYDYVIE